MKEYLNNNSMFLHEAPLNQAFWIRNVPVKNIYKRNNILCAIDMF